MSTYTSLHDRGLVNDNAIYVDGKVDHLAMRARIAHGLIMSIVFLCLKPSGAILLRVLKGNAFRVHVAWQMFAWCLAFTGVGLGVWLARVMHRFSKQHPIIGFVVAGFMFIQPFLGEIHHLIFLKVRHRTIWGRIHVWIGRLVITLGIINGGIGLGDADNSRAWIIAYSVIGGMVFLVYVGVQLSLAHDRRQEKKEKETSNISADSNGLERGGDEELQPIQRQSTGEVSSIQTRPSEQA